MRAAIDFGSVEQAHCEKIQLAEFRKKGDWEKKFMQYANQQFCAQYTT
jgi:hypothetical protein